jgi:hypothetical protein
MKKPESLYDKNGKLIQVHKIEGLVDSINSIS